MMEVRLIIFIFCAVFGAMIFAALILHWRHSSHGARRNSIHSFHVSRSGGRDQARVRDEILSKLKLRLGP